VKSEKFPHGTAPLPSIRRAFAVSYPSDRQGARLARRVAGLRLAAWGYESDAPALLIGELVANAVTHCHGAGPEFTLRLDIEAGILRIAVTDACGDHRPVRRAPSDEAESGRGLLLVETLATAWGVEDRDDGGRGKTVWAEYLLEPCEPAFRRWRRC